MKDDLISRQAALKELAAYIHLIDKTMGKGTLTDDDCMEAAKSVLGEDELPSAQPTLCGYNIEHLILIANVLRKENLPPERVVEALTDIGRIVSIVKDEFEESLRKAVEQCKV